MLANTLKILPVKRVFSGNNIKWVRSMATFHHFLPNPAGYEAINITRLFDQTEKDSQIALKQCSKDYLSYAQVICQDNKFVGVEVIYGSSSTLGQLDKDTYPYIYQKYGIQREKITKIKENETSNDLNI